MLSLGNTSNLRQHLKAKHLTEFKVVDQHLKQLREMASLPTITVPVSLIQIVGIHGYKYRKIEKLLQRYHSAFERI